MGLSLQELKNTAGIRAGLYSFFSKIFREEADLQFLKLIKKSAETFSFSNHRNKHDQNHDLDDGIKNLTEFFSENQINYDLSEELAADYASLFLGAGKHSAHPYESVHTSENRIIMQESWNDVLKTYSGHELRKTDHFTQPGDHIAIELEFMAYLCLEMQKAINKEDSNSINRLIKAQKDFIKKHLVSWVPFFCSDIIKGSAKHNFYRSVAKIVRIFVLTEESTLERR